MNSIKDLFNQYKDLPHEAILKTDLLRLGVRFSDEALVHLAQKKTKSYFIFSFDQASPQERSELEKKGLPEEIALIGGPYDLKRTIVSVRLNHQSPYRVSLENGLLLLKKGDEELCTVQTLDRPTYYDEKLKDGKSVQEVAPTIEWGYLVYLTPFRLCQYWGEKEECLFCDINENYRQQKKDRAYTGIKTVEEIVEAIAIVNRHDIEKKSQAYTVTGGAVTKDINGLDEAAFYGQFAEAIEAQFPGRWIPKVVTQALPIEQVKQLKKSGFQIYHPNYEVWDEKLFSLLCPGKEAQIGGKNWHRRILDAAEVFGPRFVIPNFVAGIEMAKPFGFETVSKAIKSTQEGLNHYMSYGITPRFTVWCVEPNTALARTNTEPPPLEYFLRLLEVYRETMDKYGLKAPPGYGEPGVGKAVFSVSAFMDVLR